MIVYISKKILKFLLDSNVIEDTAWEKEYYQYGIEITISSILNIVLIMAIGTVFHSVIESIIFLMLFIPIRQYTGGFHANSYFKCNLFFSISYMTVLMVYYATFSFLSINIITLISFLCVLIILIICPVEHVNKPIPKDRRKSHKIIAAMLSLIYGVSAVLLTAISNKYGVLILYTLLLVTVLIVAAKINEWRCKHEDCEKRC